METIINSLLNKPLAFILTIGGILFLGLSGLRKLFNIETEKTNSKRLFISGILLLLLGIPLYYFAEKTNDTKLRVKLLKVEFFQNDKSTRCNAPFTLHIRETYKINANDGAKLKKIIISQDNFIQQDFKYQDSDGNFVINYCFRPDIERNIKAMIISSSGKASDIFQYKISTIDLENIKENAPELSKY